jgi:hypothetical protein
MGEDKAALGLLQLSLLSCLATAYKLTRISRSQRPTSTGLQLPGSTADLQPRATGPASGHHIPLLLETPYRKR